jgi:hypothetical protein
VYLLGYVTKLSVSKIRRERGITRNKIAGVRPEIWIGLLLNTNLKCFLFVDLSLSELFAKNPLSHNSLNFPTLYWISLITFLRFGVTMIVANKLKRTWKKILSSFWRYDSNSSVEGLGKSVKNLGAVRIWTRPPERESGMLTLLDDLWLLRRLSELSWHSPEHTAEHQTLGFGCR